MDEVVNRYMYEVFFFHASQIYSWLSKIGQRARGKRKRKFTRGQRQVIFHNQKPEIIERERTFQLTLDGCQESFGILYDETASHLILNVHWQEKKNIIPLLRLRTFLFYVLKSMDLLSCSIDDEYFIRK